MPGSGSFSASFLFEIAFAVKKQQAEYKIVEAQGIADYQRIISKSLSEKQLQYEQIKAMKELAQSENAKNHSHAI